MNVNEGDGGGIEIIISSGGEKKLEKERERKIKKETKMTEVNSEREKKKMKEW